MYKNTHSKKFAWAKQNDIEFVIMQTLAKEIQIEVDAQMIKALRGEHYSYGSSPLKDGTI